MESSDVILIAVIVLVPAALMWAIFIARSGRPGKPPRPSLGIPRALRPAESDEKLEGPRLERLLIWGVHLHVLARDLHPGLLAPRAGPA